MQQGYALSPVEAQVLARRLQQKATQRLVISPMVDEYAQRVAKKLGIEVYSYAGAVEAL